MVSTYPSVTAGQSASSWGFNKPPGKTFGPGQVTEPKYPKQPKLPKVKDIPPEPGPKKVPKPPAAAIVKIPIGKVPKKLRPSIRPSLAEAVGNVTIDMLDIAVDRVQEVISQGVKMPYRYWQVSGQCLSYRGIDYIRASTYTCAGLNSCTIPPTGWVQPGTALNANTVHCLESFGFKTVAGACGTQQGRYEMHKSLTFTRRTGYVGATPTKEYSPMPFKGAEVGTDFGIVWDYPKPKKHRPGYAKPKPGEEPSKEPEGAPKPEEETERPKNPMVITLPGLQVGPFIRPPVGWDYELPPVVVTPGQPGTGTGVVVHPSPGTGTGSNPGGGGSGGSGSTGGGGGRPGKGPPIPNPANRPGKGKPPKVNKKVNVATVAGALWTGINTTTEVMDFIQAMHKSIKDDCAHGGRLSSKASKKQVLEYMLTHAEVWRCIDLAEAVQNFINMQIGDYASALGSQSTKKIAQDIGALTGVDRAFASLMEGMAEVTGIEGGVGELFPTIDIDQDDGVIYVIGPAGVLNFYLPTG